MATSNFCYDNRCVVVTNDDYECGNHPQLDEYRPESLRSYPSHKLAGYDFIFWDVVLTLGYYEHACIDYVERPDSRNVYDYFNGFRCSGKEIYDFLEDKFDEFVEYAAAIERKKVEAAIDKIKADYGYEEYGVYARFNNGETWYSKIA